MGVIKMLTLEKFKEAAAKVKEVTNDTSLMYSQFFSDETGNEVYLKPENLQKTGAYKLRGAYYKISTLPDEDRKKGLIAASAGNHAQGVAFAARQYGVKAVIVMPESTPLIKVNRTKALGAEVVLHGAIYDEACAHAYKLAEEHGYTFIHPFDDETVATGQGSIMMEIYDELKDVDIVLVPIGGGGLATGISGAAKLINPNIRVIGVEPAGAPSLKAALEAGGPTPLDKVSTIADGTAVRTIGSVVFPYLQKNLDSVITITDEELVTTFIDVVENHKMVAENSGLLAVAALRHLDVKGKKVVAIVSGGNMDVSTMATEVEHGLIMRGRLCSITAILSDNPGELSKITGIISKAKGNVVNIEHVHHLSTGTSDSVRVILTLRCFSREHKEEIINSLKNEGYKIEETEVRL